MNTDYTELTISLDWQNSWFIDGPPNRDLQDAAWIFIKYRNQNATQWRHLVIDEVLSSTSSAGDLQALSGYKDGIYTLHDLESDYAGDAQLTFTVAIGDSVDLIKPSFQVHAIEMVDPLFQSEFEIGDGISMNRFCDGGDTSSVFTYSGAGTIDIADSPGALWSIDGTMEPGIINVNDPGYSFCQFVMKYEISQQQYVDFLNSLTREQQNARTETDLNDSGNTNAFVMSDTSTPSYRNGIRRDTFVATGPYTFYVDLNNNGISGDINDGGNVACNYLSPGDLMAYCDWACLRPMGEIEYERLCRSAEPAVAGEYAWGTTDLTFAFIAPTTSGRPWEVAIQTGLNGLCRASDNGPMRTGFAARDTTDRLMSGATVEGIMEMTGNVAELVASISTVADRYFRAGSWGDGALTILGEANVSDWPTQLTVRGRSEDQTKIWTVSHRGLAYASGRSPFHGGRGVRPVS